MIQLGCLNCLTISKYKQTGNFNITFYVRAPYYFEMKNVFTQECNYKDDNIVQDIVNWFHPNSTTLYID